jgi:hypothetical protein
MSRLAREISRSQRPPPIDPIKELSDGLFELRECAVHVITQMTRRIMIVMDTLNATGENETIDKASEIKELSLVRDYRISVMTKEAVKEIVNALETEMRAAMEELHQEKASQKPLTRHVALARKMKIDVSETIDAVSTWVQEGNEKPLRDIYAAANLAPSPEIRAELSAPDSTWRERLRVVQRNKEL